MSRLRELLGGPAGDPHEPTPEPPPPEHGGSAAETSASAIAPSKPEPRAGTAARGRAGQVPATHVHVARAELVLARAAHLPVAKLPLRPEDPLTLMANAIADVRRDLGESAEVVIDLVPLTPAKVAHLMRQVTKRAAGQAGLRRGVLLRCVGAVAGVIWEVLSEFLPYAKSTPGRGTALGSGSASRTPRVVTENKFATQEPVFAVQVLLRCTSEIPGRAESHLRRLITAFDIYQSPHNHWKVRGVRLPGVHIGADTFLFRRRFERRFTTGWTKPPRRNIVTTSEIAGLLKPPTQFCKSPAVARSRGWIPPAPRELPTYAPARRLVRLGHVTDVNGEERLIGIPTGELLFSARFGKAGFGKTEQALCQAIDIAREGGGVWFLDPHADGWRRAKPYLSDPALRPRLWEVDLTLRGPNARLPGWNPLSMEGFTVEHIEDRVDAVVTSFATALSWGDSAPRAKAILTKACEALCYLAMRLPPECAPTIFQIPSLLDDEFWRQAVIGPLPKSVRHYWDVVFPKLGPDATPVITNPINRLRTSRTLSAFLGSSRSTYDVRAGMDTSKIVFVCTPGSGESNKLVTSFLIYDLFRAGRSRIDTPPQRRRRVDAFIDELAAVDGASRGHLAAILEQLRKFLVALHAMNQMPDRLTPDTRRALMTNQSLLMSSAAAVDGARAVAREFGRDILPGTIVELEKFHHVTTATLGGQRTTPFKIRGLHVDDEFAEHYHPEWDAAVDQALNANLQRRTVDEVLEELETLDERIVQAVTTAETRFTSTRGRPPASHASGSAQRSTRGSGAGVDLAPPVGLDGAPATGPAGSADAGHATVVPMRRHAPSPYQSTVE